MSKQTEPIDAVAGSIVVMGVGFLLAIAIMVVALLAAPR